MLVLAIVNKEDSYGYEVDRIICQTMGIENFTSYQTLKKLHEQDFLVAYNQSSQGRNRRYYKITEKGKQLYQEMIDTWEAYKEAMDDIIGMGICSKIGKKDQD